MSTRLRKIQIQVTGVTENGAVISFVETDRKNYFRRTDEDHGSWIYIDRESISKLRLDVTVTFVDIDKLAITGSAVLQRVLIENDLISCQWSMAEDAIITGKVVSLTF